MGIEHFQMGGCGTYDIKADSENKFAGLGE
jgi:hypothetical protein